MGRMFPEDVGDNTLASLLELFWTACCSHIKYHVSFLETHQQQCAISLIIFGAFCTQTFSQDRVKGELEPSHHRATAEEQSFMLTFTPTANLIPQLDHQ